MAPSKAGVTGSEVFGSAQVRPGRSPFCASYGVSSRGGVKPLEKTAFSAPTILPSRVTTCVAESVPSWLSTTVTTTTYDASS